MWFLQQRGLLNLETWPTTDLSAVHRTHPKSAWGSRELFRGASTLLSGPLLTIWGSLEFSLLPRPPFPMAQLQTVDSSEELL